MKTIAILAAALLATAGASAQNVYRCGSSYADAPCDGARVVAAADTRSDADRAHARDVLARDRALARELRAERVALQQENAVKGSGAFGIQAAKPQPDVKARPKAPKEKPKKKAAPKPLRPAA